MKLKTFYTLFYLAVAMFVAKPFLGFSIISLDAQAMGQHSLLAKSFTIRKPEDLKDAENNKASIHYQLSNPPAILFLSITLLLGLLFPAAFKKENGISYSFLNGLRFSLIPVHPNVLNGKFTI